MSSKPETAVVASILAALDASGDACAWRNQSGAVRVRRGYMHLAPVGAPDIVGWLRDGRFLGIEVKVPGAKTAKERAAQQASWRKRITAAGGVAGQVTSASEAIALVRDALGRVER